MNYGLSPFTKHGRAYLVNSEASGRNKNYGGMTGSTKTSLNPAKSPFSSFSQMTNSVGYKNNFSELSSQHNLIFDLTPKSNFCNNTPSSGKIRAQNNKTNFEEAQRSSFTLNRQGSYFSEIEAI
jgi:hypothetical protein